MFGGRKESRGRNERAEAAPAQDRHPRKPLAKALGTQSLWSQTSEHTLAARAGDSEHLSDRRQLPRNIPLANLSVPSPPRYPNPRSGGVSRGRPREASRQPRLLRCLLWGSGRPQQFHLGKVFHQGASRLLLPQRLCWRSQAPLPALLGPLWK